MGDDKGGKVVRVMWVMRVVMRVTRVTRGGEVGEGVRVITWQMQWQPRTGYQGLQQPTLRYA